MCHHYQNMVYNILHTMSNSLHCFITTTTTHKHINPHPRSTKSPSPSLLFTLLLSPTKHIAVHSKSERNSLCYLQELMASCCIQSCVNDTQAPVRATYVNLYKWPESDAEFIRSMSSSSMRKGSVNSHGDLPRARVVDSISCRQICLRSYTFSREEEGHVEEKTKCLGRAKKGQGAVAEEDGRRGRLHGGGNEDDRRKIRSCGGGGGGKGRGSKRRKCGRLRRVKEVSCNALVSIFRRLLNCTTEVDGNCT